MSSSERIRVEVDADFQALVPGFLETRRREIPRLRELLAAEELAEIAAIGHRLAGAGGGYGFMFITEMGRILERAGETRDGDAISGAVDALEAYLDRVEVHFVVIPEDSDEE
ncbi:MAG: Hpt domain-containing protein [Candidatus Sericytochromatia bacterium]|nr:Hpt domain-containing protein [Candidatus Tanganyikabacteria bacterium]